MYAYAYALHLDNEGVNEQGIRVYVDGYVIFYHHMQSHGYAGDAHHVHVYAHETVSHVYVHVHAFLLNEAILRCSSRVMLPKIVKKDLL